MRPVETIRSAVLRRGDPLFDMHHGPAKPIWDYPNWDVCLVLDACRWDLLDEVAPEYAWLPDEIGSARSVGSMSPEWISATFNHWMARHAGYISGNPFTAKTDYDPVDGLPIREGAHVSYLDEAWRDAWVHDDEELGVSTIPPEALTERAIWAWRNRESLGIKRLVTHYMQPHTPWPARSEWFGDSRNLSAFGEPEREADNERDIWLRLRDGEVDLDAVWEAYADALRWALDSVETLIENCDATVAITSDHGNGLGEWGVWSHPPHMPHAAVRKVPWVLVDGCDERAVAPGPVAESGQNRRVEEKLAALGYVEE